MFFQFVRSVPTEGAFPFGAGYSPTQDPDADGQKYDSEKSAFSEIKQYLGVTERGVIQHGQTAKVVDPGLG